MDEIELMRIVKRKIGGGYVTNKFDITDEEIEDVLREEVLPEISTYYPNYISYILDTVTDRVPDRGRNYFFLKTDVPIRSVVNLYNSEGMNSLNGIDPRIHGSGNFTFDWMNNNLMSFVLIQRTFWLEENNKIFIDPPPMNRKIGLTLAVDHKTTMSVSIGLREQIIKITLGKIAELILARRKQFSALNTTFGEISLNLEPFEKMVEDMNNVIIEMKDFYANDFLKNITIG